MAESKKNNNLLYTVLVIVGLLLLLIPFFIFDVGSSVNGTGHLTRFGLHILAFTSALFIGSMFSAGITKVVYSSSVVTMKVAAVATAVVVGGAVTYNTLKHASSDPKIVLNQASRIYADSFMAPVVPDSIASENTNDAADSTSEIIASTEENPSVISSTETKETIVPAATNNDKKTDAESGIVSESKNLENKTVKIDKTKTNNNTPVPNNTNTTTNTNELAESCNTFQVLHGSKQLDRKLGLSVFDPNKSIRFNNDCGCILKDASMSLSRGSKILEQKIQNGNFINLHTFKDLQADDRLTVEISKANCKNDKGTAFLYTFPKPILTVVLISDHREFETATELKNNKANPKESNNSTSKPIQKDKVEEEMNKYGN